MVQIPDGFDHQARCIVVSASSGSRGIYGAIALAGAWGLPHGCAVAYTDKGAGTDYLDVSRGTGVALDGRSEERLVGKAGGCTVRLWGWPSYQQKKKITLCI